MLRVYPPTLTLNARCLQGAEKHLAASLLPHLLVYFWVFSSSSSRSVIFRRLMPRAVSYPHLSCALKLAIPIAVLSAMRESSGYHISVKGGRFLEAVAKADTIVFDKTGTLNYATPLSLIHIWVLKPGGTFLICNESNGDSDKDEKWTEIIGGMTIYRDTELKAYLEQAGFHEVQIYKKKSWLCVTARK